MAEASDVLNPWIPPLFPASMMLLSPPQPPNQSLHGWYPASMCADDRSLCADDAVSLCADDSFAMCADDSLSMCADDALTITSCGRGSFFCFNGVLMLFRDVSCCIFLSVRYFFVEMYWFHPLDILIYFCRKLLGKLWLSGAYFMSLQSTPAALTFV